MDISKGEEFFKNAVALVIRDKKASVSYLQRKLTIGYSRAAKIIDEMEDRGFIGPSEGKVYRKVLITPEQFKELYGEDFNTL